MPSSLKCQAKKAMTGPIANCDWLIATKAAKATVDLSRESIVELAERALPTHAVDGIAVILEGLRCFKVGRSMRTCFGTDPAYGGLTGRSRTSEVDCSQARPPQSAGWTSSDPGAHLGKFA